MENEKITLPQGKSLRPQDKREKTDHKIRLLYVLLIIGMGSFGLASFFLGWNIHYYINPLIVCGPGPFGSCLSGRMPLYIVGLASLAETAATAFVGLTLRKIIHLKDIRIQELKEKLEKPTILE